MQLKIGEDVIIFSDKAYRRNKDNLFQAVGSVVIVHGDETLYGESATLKMDEGHFKIEGNVRLISKNLTIYGSKIEYSTQNGNIEVHNARIATESFYVVAKKIIRRGDKVFYAEDAEYSTCKDCPESWSIFGSEISVTFGEYVTIKHALFKINTINVMYIPYLVLPAKKDRETGLLFPNLSTRLSEGFALVVPWFWAISQDKDLTLSPTFWAKRGYGSDIEYRQEFDNNSWLKLSSRFLNDTIYLPGKLNNDKSGEDYFRYFVGFENHYQMDQNYTHHFYILDSRDMDIVRDHPTMTDNYIRGSELGASGFVNMRSDSLSFGIDSHFNHNQLTDQPTEFDDSYVQILPKVDLSIAPINILNTDVFGLNNIYFGFDSDYTHFKQNNVDEVSFIRNAKRLNFVPYVNWNFGNWGPVNFNSKFFLDFQHYNFDSPTEEDFKKYAGRVNTEISFTLEKIFGLAYEEKVEKIEEEDKEKPKKKKIRKSFIFLGEDSNATTIGKLEEFEDAFKDNKQIVPKHAYKHAQEFKFIHHYISDDKVDGNDRYLNQIQSNDGWFDYVDAIRSEENVRGINQTRTIISPINTLEFQWNNNLIKKSPRHFDFFVDQRYLLDNFQYNRLAYFNLSQGYEFEQSNNDPDTGSLTRLYLNSGYQTNDWRVTFRNYYFHQDKNNITQLGFDRRFEIISFFANLNLNSFSTTTSKQTTYGFHLRPSDRLGFTVNFQYDLENKQTVRSLYAIDIQPYNNCWKFVLNYRNTVVDNRLSFDWVLNFGQSNFNQLDTSLRRF